MSSGNNKVSIPGHEWFLNRTIYTCKKCSAFAVAEWMSRPDPFYKSSYHLVLGATPSPLTCEEIQIWSTLIK